MPQGVPKVIGELKEQLAEALRQVEARQARIVGLVEETHRQHQIIAELERDRAAIAGSPGEVYHSVRSVERAIGQRFTAAPDERIVGAQPGHNGKVIVWLASQRGAPEVPEADRTPEGERAVTEEVAGG